MNILKGFFKSKEEEQASTVPKRAEVNRHLTIAAVHDTFLTESERLLEEAKDILGLSEKKIEVLKPTIEAKKSIANRLASLGFSRASQVKQHNEVVAEAEKLEETAKYAKETAKLILYYSTNYYHRFITEKGVEALCRKYGLVHAPVNIFISEVPEKNLIEMEQFLKVGVKEEDCFYYTKWGRDSSGRNELSYYEWRIQKEQIEEREREINISTDNLALQQFRKRYIRKTDPDAIIHKSKEFQICALPKDFDLKGREIKDYKAVLKEDPIVLFRVRGGYLIVTAWGDEANDEAVVNAKNN